MKRKLVGVFALAMTALMLLGGCGESGKSDDQPASETDKYVQLPEYKGIEVNVSSVESLLETKLAQFYFDAVMEPGEVTDRAVAVHDMVNIDYEGKKDGVAFDGGTAQGSNLLIGSGQFIPGFEEGLVGVMPGETVDLNLKFPDNYGSSDLAGQEVVFTVKVNYISRMADEYVEGMGLEGVTNLEQLREYIKDAKTEEAETEFQANMENVLMDYIMTNAVFSDLPADEVEKNRQLYVGWFEQMASYYGTDVETYFSWYGEDYETVLNQYAETYTKQMLIIQAIADKEKLHLSDKELDERMKQLADDAGTTVEELLSNGASLEDCRENFLYEDVMNYLMENAVNKAE